MFKDDRHLNYLDYLSILYRDDFTSPQITKRNPVINVTFEVTTDCCCKCSYCYETNKSHNFMTKDTAKKCVDTLFDMYYDEHNDMIIPEYNLGVVLEFIGGEPLMNIDVIDFCCSYFYEKAISLHHPWATTWMVSMISNGAYYFDSRFLKFLQKFKGHVYFNVTIDGPKEMHDHCRVYKNGTGNFDDAWKALLDYYSKFPNFPKTTKVTISPENLKYLNTVIEFFLGNDINNIRMNVVYEHKWTYEESQIYYKILKKAADTLLNIEKDCWVSVFSEIFFQPAPEDQLECWCGGDGRMIGFDTEGKMYPCIRFMPISLGEGTEPLCIGDCNKGFCNTEEQKNKLDKLRAMNRRTQSTDDCFYCKIATGCPTCIANDYQITGELGGSRTTMACNMHKAASLANCYFWNKYYKKYNINKSFHRYLSNEEALKIISEEELNMLDSLEKENI